MYTEEYNKRPFPFRDFLLKFIIVVIFVLLIIWLIPKFTQPKLKKTSTKEETVLEQNILKMKEAAITYYSKEENLPEDGKKEVLTLRQMVNQKLLSAFRDKDGKACNVDKSYVQVTKENEEYLLKVNLQCSEEEDYILTKIGKYTYCENSKICEKDLTKQETQTQEEQKEEKPKEEVPKEEEKVEKQEEKKEEPKEEVTPQPQPEPAKTTLYEYKKEIPGVFSNWSSCDENNLSNWKLNSDRLPESICDNNDKNCLKQIRILRRKEYIGVDNGVKIYATRVYYCIQTRTYQEGSTDIKWSSNNNDQSLIQNGYVLTGKTKVE